MIPSADPEDKQKHDLDVEAVAMKVVTAFEESKHAHVKDVHTPPLARAAGLTDYPGFDILSVRPDKTQRAIEVKGRAGVGEVEITYNEWAKACNLRQGYWLYVVYDCATSNPRLLKVQDPFDKLLAKAKGSVRIGQGELFKVAECENV